MTKYEHRLQEVFNFTRGEIAILCVMLLRGPQTPGELRGRTERMHRFEDLDQVQFSLQKLMQREPPLALVLPRQPGTKEARYAHLLAGEPEGFIAGVTHEIAASPRGIFKSPEIEELEAKVAELQSQIDELREQFSRFRKQFE